MEKTIKEIMLAEHGRLNLLLDNFERALVKDSLKAQEKLDILRWNLEKHFFLEERAVFLAYISKTENEKSEVDRLIKEHVSILELVRDMEKDFSYNRKINFSELRDKLVLHSGFEDKVFYPKLETELNEEQKQDLILKSQKLIED
jgi:hypothetical protein